MTPRLTTLKPNICFTCHIRKVHQQGCTEPARDALIHKIGQEKFAALKQDASPPARSHNNCWKIQKQNWKGNKHEHRTLATSFEAPLPGDTRAAA